MLEANTPNTEANIPLLGLFSFGKVGSNRPISFVKTSYAVQL